MTTDTVVETTTSEASKPVFVSGTVYEWASPNGKKRRYMADTLPWGKFSEMTKVYALDPSKSAKAHGEQREQDASHVRKLSKAILEGEYTPTTFSVGLYADMRKGVDFEDEGREATVYLNPKKPLPLIDGGHRSAAIRLAVESLEKQAKEFEKKQEEKAAEIRDKIAAINSLPISFVLYLDGDTKSDFVNLQAGRAVSKAHLLSLEMLKKDCDEETKLAYEIAKELEGNPKSPFRGWISLTGAKTGGGKGLAVNALVSNRSGEISTTLAGLARIGMMFAAADAKYLAKFVMMVDKIITDEQPQLFDKGKVLTPIYRNGAKGTTHLLICLANCLAWRTLKEWDGNGELPIPEEDTLTWVSECAANTLDKEVKGSYSAADRRDWAFTFAIQFFNPEEEMKVSEVGVGDDIGIPLSLARLLGLSCWGMKAPDDWKDWKEPKPEDEDMGDMPTPDGEEGEVIDLTKEGKEKKKAAKAKAEKEKDENEGEEKPKRRRKKKVPA